MNASGATGYTWTPSTGLSATTGATVTASPTVTTTYTVTGSVAGGCTASSTVTLTVLPRPLLSRSLGSSSCGLPNGSINLSVSGAAGPYTYLWSNGVTVQDQLFSLVAGVYTVTVTSSNGCTSALSATVPNAPAPTISLTPTSSTCSLSNGLVGCTVTGGTAPYAFTWNNGATTQNLTNVAAGIYAVTVTAANGCTVASSTTVSNSASPSLSATTSNAACGVSNGGVTLVVTNGTAPFTFTWSNGSTTQNISNLSPGSYSVTIHDANNCIDSTAANVVTVSGPSVSTVATSSTCGNANGSVNATIASGTAPYTYLWSNGATTEDLVNKSAGTYTITVTDANSCTATATATVSNIPGPTLTRTSSDTKCGLANGSIDVSAAGGTAPLSYLWSNGATTQDLINILPAGTYTVTITDANTCTASISTVIGVIPPPSLTISATAATCSFSNGSVDITVTGGSAPYGYSWNGGVYNTQDLVYVPAGTYSVVLTDINGCTATASATVTNSNPVLSTNVTAACNNTGAVDLTVTGGAAPYYYSWNTGSNAQDISGLMNGSYSVTVTDGNACTVATTVNVASATTPALSWTTTLLSCSNQPIGTIDLSVTSGIAPYTYSWSTGATTQDVANLGLGSFVVTVTGANGCAASAAIGISSSGGPTFTLTAVNPSCGMNNGSIDYIPLVGSASAYLWSTGATTQDISGLAPGVYDVTVTKSNGCGSVGAVILTNQPVHLLSYTPQNATCGASDGGIDLYINGGNPPFTYAWSNGATVQDPTNLSGGVYIVTVTSVTGCTATLAAAVSNLTAPALSATVLNSTCGNNNGKITLAVVGGTGPFTYLWNNGATTQNRTNIGAGTYTVTVTDVNGCAAITVATVTNTPSPTVSIATTSSICSQANGSLTSTVSSGTSPFTYSWNGGAYTTPNLTNASAGAYTLNVTDAYGCTASASATLNNIAAPTLSRTIANAKCGLSNGSINLSLSGGTAPFTYLWSNGATIQDLLGWLAPGTYVVTVTDANGCTSTISTNIINIPGPTVSAVASPSICSLPNGLVDATVSSGTAPFTYNWNSNAYTTQDLTNVSTGTYTLIVKDANNCTATVSAIVSNIPSPTLGINTANPTCSYSNGAIDLVVIGGTSPFTYNWNGNVYTVQDLSNIAAGSYAVTVTDANNCTAGISTVLTNSVGPSLSHTHTDATCSQANGNINLNVISGTAPFDFTWNDGATTEDRTNILAGTYNVTVTDANGCSALHSATVMDLMAPNITASAVPEACFQANGQLSVVVNTGNAPYSYLWSNGATTTNVSNVANGNYIVTVTDVNGCTTSASALVGNLSSPSVAFTTGNSTCSNANGSIDITITAGTSPYSYLWSNGATTQDISNILAGSYTVTVTDVNGCSDVEPITVIDEPSPNINTVNTNSTCGYANGTAAVSVVSGGTTPFNYSWSNGATVSNPVNLIAGTYTVTVTDGNGCTDVSSTTIVNIAGPSLSVLPTQSTCALPNGSVDLTVSGGTSPFTYSWNGGTYNTQDLSNILAGSYSVIVTDANSCTASITSVVTNIASPTLSRVIASSTCGYANGSVDLTVAGGTAPFVYTWSNGTTTQDQSNVLAAGIYTVTVTDANNCTVSISSTVNNIAGPTVAATPTASTCSLPNGSVNATVSSGTAPFAFSWNSGLYTTEDLTNVLAGAYTLIVTDANSCTATVSTTVIDFPSPVLSITNISSTCGYANGSVDLTVTGGTAPFVYTWSNAKTTQDLSNVTAGTYTVTVTDANGCTVPISTTVSNIAGPSVSAIPTSSTCALPNGLVDATVSGGTAPFTYSWNGGVYTTQDLTNVMAGSYTLVVTDANVCTASVTSIVTNIASPTLTRVITSSTCGYANGSVDLTVNGGTAPFVYAWSNGTTTQDQTNNLMAGIYTATVTDANNCTVSISSTVNNISGPTVAATPTASTCSLPNGSVNATVSSGTAPFTYSWNAGAYTTEDLTNILAGAYTLIVTDANSCTATVSTTVIDIPSPVLTITNNSSTCGYANGLVDLTVTGGTAPFVYSWSNSKTTQDLSNVLTGTYSVTVTDANGCTVPISTTVNNIAGPSVSAIPTSSTCALPNGLVDATVSGGTSPFTYSWNGGTYTTQDLTNVMAGSYTLVVTDANVCTASVTAVVTNIASPTLSRTFINSTCGYANGSIDLSVNGGTPPFTYLWSNGATIQDQLIVLSAGLYTVTVTDANSCTVAISTTINNIAGPTLSALATSTTCSYANGSVNATVIGGTSPFTYNWNSGAYNTQDLTNILAGTYSLIVTDANTCTATISVNVTDFPGPNNLTLTPTNADCGFANGQIVPAVTGGTTPYTYNWSNGTTNASLTNVFAGTYSLTVSDANGCTISGNATVGDNAAQTVVLTATDATCNLDNGLVGTVVTGGIAPFTYNWSNGGSSATISNLIANTYNVTVTDARGCTTSGTVYVDSVFGPYFDYAVTLATCYQSNGAIDLNVYGGTAPLTYSWNNGLYNTQDISALAPGTYTMAFNDANNCSDTVIVQVNAISVPTIDLDSTFASCGYANGSASVTVNGSTGPYTFAWNDPASSTNPFANSLFGNQTYSVTVTDTNNCVIAGSIFVTDQPSPVASASFTSSTCGYANGTAVANVASGGTAPFTYLWSNGVTTSTNPNLLAATYSVTITDANGCTSAATTPVLDIPGPVLTTTPNQSTCSLANGSINLAVTSGTAPFAYVWSNGSSNQNLTNVMAGTYSVTVTDANGCTAISSNTINDAASPTLSLNAIGTTCSYANGSVMSNVVGGTAPFNYLWNIGANTPTLSFILAGTYSMTVTDVNGCTASASAIVVDAPSPQLSTIVTDATCELDNGDIALTVTSGTSPFTYDWSNTTTDQNLSNVFANTYNVVVTDANGCTAGITNVVNNIASPTASSTTTNSTCGYANGIANLQVNGGTAPFNYLWSNGMTTEDASGVSIGIYSVTVTDANGCTVSTAMTVFNTPGATVSLTSTNSTCSAANGTVDLSSSNGTLPFVYSWSNGATTEDLSNVLAGNYDVTLTDANSCITTATIIVIDEPSPTISLNVTNTTCGFANGAIDATINGGTIPFVYNWSNGATTEDVNGLVDGNYTLSVTDANGCLTIASINVGNSTSPMVTTTSTPEICSNANGTVTSSTTAGTTPYSYLWSNGATTQNISSSVTGSYAVTVTDIIGCTATSTSNVGFLYAPELTTLIIDATCEMPNGSISLDISGNSVSYVTNWSNGATTEDLANVYAGTYAVTVIDTLGCSSTATATIVTTQNPDIAYATVQPTCNLNNGVINMSATNGQPGYSYSWSNGATGSSQTSLAPNAYTVTVTDQGGCKDTAVVVLSPSTAPVLMLNASSYTICANQSTTLSATGLQTYSWSPATGLNQTTGNNVIATLTNPITYTVTALDSIGCVAVEQIAVMVNQNPSYTITAPAEICYGQTAQLSASGVGLYTWTGNGIIQTVDSNTIVAMPLVTTTYYVTTTNQWNCTTSDSTVVVVNPLPVMTTSVDDDSICVYEQSSLTVNGANTYQWFPNTGLTLVNDSNSIAGPDVSTTYTIYGTNGFGCVDTSYINITVFNQPVVTVSQPDTAICELSTLAITAAGANTYTWTPSFGLSNTSGAAVMASPGVETTYTVVGTSLDGCTANATATVHIAAPLTLNLSASSAEMCYGQSVSLDVNGAEDFNWTPSVVSSDSTYTSIVAMPNATTTYNIVGTNSNGCTGTASIVVTVNPLPNMSVNNALVCPGFSDVLTANGAATYQWTPSTGINQTTGNTVIASPQQTTTYTIYGTSLKGCIDTVFSMVTVAPAPVASFTGLDSMYCATANVVTLNGSPSGGAFSGAGISGNTFTAGTAGAGFHQVVYIYTDSLGCKDTVVQSTQVYDNPTVTVSDASVCYGLQVTMSANGGLTYNWNTTANIIATNNDEIALQPDTTTTVSVVGTDLQGCSDTAQATVTVWSLPVVDFGVPNIAYCVNGDTALMLGSPAGGVFSGVGMNGNVFDPAVSGVGTFHITYTYTDANGCVNDTGKNITVNTFPTMTSTSDTSMCYSDTIVLTATGASTYSWTPANGLVQTSGSAVNASPIATTTYVVTGVDANGCSSQSQTEVIVYQLPNVTATNGKACLGLNDELIASGAATYAWTPSTGLNTTTGSQVASSATASTTYTIVGTSAQGCTSLGYSVFTVDTIPVVTMTGLDSTYCVDDSAVTLIGNPSGGMLTGIGVNGSTFDPSVANVGFHQVVYYFADMNGCSSADTQQTTINALPMVTVTNAEYCAGETATLNASGAIIYNWTPSTFLNADSNVSVVTSTPNTTSYTVTGTDANGCSSSAVSTVIVHAIPLLAVSDATPSICIGNDTTLTASGADSYAWSPNVNLSATTGSTITASPVMSLTYTLIGNSTFGCSDTLSIPLTVQALPIAAAGVDALICEGNSTQLNAYSDASVAWTPSATLSNANILNPTAAPDTTTTYTLTATNAFGCTATDLVIITVVNDPNIQATGGGFVCYGSTIQLHATGGGIFEWSPATYLTNTVGANPVCTPLDNITYTVTTNASLGCPSSDTVVVTVKQPITITTGNGARICQGESYQLAAYTDGLTYEWSPSNHLDNPYVPFPYATPLVSTTYTVTTTDNICFTVSDTVVLNVNPPPAFALSDDALIVAGTGQQLFAEGNGTFTWTPAAGLSCSDCPSPFANPTQPTTYTVTLEDSAGCRKDAEVVIDFLCSKNGIYVPNTFTPNGDGKNDVFRIRGYGMKELKSFRIFTRWGELVFETNDIEQGWDGTFKGQRMSPAVFVYTIEGVCTNDQVVRTNGNVKLLR